MGLGRQKIFGGNVTGSSRPTMGYGYEGSHIRTVQRKKESKNDGDQE